MGGSGHKVGPEHPLGSFSTSSTIEQNDAHIGIVTGSPLDAHSRSRFGSCIKQFNDVRLKKSLPITCVVTGPVAVIRLVGVSDLTTLNPIPRLRKCRHQFAASFDRIPAAMIKVEMRH